MSLRKQLIRGAVTLGTAQAAGQVLSFVRNIIIARMLTQADFGVAATFALTVSLLEMSSNLAASKLLIQSKDGDDERLQGVVQLFEAVRGLILGLALFAIAGPVAALFDVPEATWAFRVLALSPVIKGFRHLDIARYQRDMRFGPSAILETGSQVLAVCAAWPLAAWLGDYSAVLYIVLLREGMLTIVSHFMAERRYCLAWDSEHARRVFAFGWPLLLNGVLMYAAVQGDRLIVGATYTMADLGLYSAAATLAATPVMALARFHSSLALPALARAQDEMPSFFRRHRAGVNALALFAAAMAGGCILIGPELMTLSFGEKYAAAGLLLAWIGAGQAIRVVRMGASVAAMSLGDTRNPLVANVARLVGVAGGAACVALGYELWTIAAAAMLGEIVALLASSLRLQIKQNVPQRFLNVPALAVLVICGLCALAYTLPLGIRAGLLAGLLLAIAILTRPLVISPNRKGSPPRGSIQPTFAGADQP